MKSTVNASAAATLTFPFLGIADNGMVVLFSERGAGTIVAIGRSVHQLGYRSTCWAPSEFKPLVGTLTLES